MFADQLRAKADAAKAAEVKAIEDAAYAKARSELLAQGAVVFPPPSDGGSPLSDGLSKKPVEGQKPVDIVQEADGSTRRNSPGTTLSARASLVRDGYGTPV